MESYIMDIINYLLGKNTALVYALFFISSFLQVVFPPHPGDVIIIFQGYLTSLDNPYTFGSIFINSFCATYFGSYCIYKLGYIKGNHVLDYKLMKKYLSEKHMAKAKGLLDKYGYFAVFISKFIPGLNIITILSAGIFKVRGRIVYLSVLASTIVHHVIYILLGRFLGYNMQYIKHLLATYNGIIAILIILCLGGYLIYYFVLNKKAQRGKV